MTKSKPESPYGPIETIDEHRQTLGLEGYDSRQLQFMSKMRMHSQATTATTIKEEEAVIRSQPDVLDTDTIVYDDEGWDSRVFVVNGGATCYKFPRSPEVLASYGREIAALNMISSLNMSIRTQRFKSLDQEGRFFSYHGLVGTQLSELLGSIDVSEKQRIGSEIGSFLKVLHSKELEGAPLVTVADEVEEYKAKYQLALPTIESNFSAKEQSSIAEFFYDYMPDEMERLGGEIKLCHGDLGSYNIVIGDDGTPGIIDFGNVGYYEQSKDFIDFGDDDVLDAVYKAYGDSPRLRAKAAVRMIALPAIDLVYYMGKKDAHGLDATIDRLRGSLQTFPRTVEGES